MLERSVPYLKLIAVLLGALVLYQLVSITIGSGPLPRGDLSVPASIDETEGDSENEGKGKGEGPRGRRGRNVPPEVQALVDSLIESEVFGEKPKPKPLTLFGIAGSSVFLRTPGGKTGRVKEGEELGEVKVIRIGSNRVLVEHKGEQKELKIFKGLGGDSLLSESKE